LKGGEAETYENVEITYIHGRKAVLTIFHNGEEQEKVDLSALPMRDDMHAMFLEKGFVLKSEQEREAIRQTREREMLEDKEFKEAQRLEKELAQFDRRTEREIKGLDEERKETKDWNKKAKLAAQMQEKQQHMKQRREETHKRFQEIEANKKMRKLEAEGIAREIVAEL
jgi:hypothetical protein